MRQKETGMDNLIFYSCNDSVEYHISEENAIFIFLVTGTWGPLRMGSSLLLLDHSILSHANQSVSTYQNTSCHDSPGNMISSLTTHRVC